MAKEAYDIVKGRLVDIYGRDLGPAPETGFKGVDTRAYTKLQPTSMLGGNQSQTPGFDTGNLITGNDLAQNTAAINTATNIAQTPYLPGQQDVLVDGAPVMNPDFGKAAPDLGPSISDQFADNVKQDSSFLQTKDAKGINSGGGISSKQLSGASGLASGLSEMIGSESSGDAALSGALSGAAMGMSAASMASLAATGPVGIAVIAGSAILGAFMGSRKAKKARQAREKAEKQRQKEIKEKRQEDVYTAKMNADQAAFANLQRAVSSALRRDNQVKIRT